MPSCLPIIIQVKIIVYLQYNFRFPRQNGLKPIFNELNEIIDVCPKNTYLNV